MTQSTKPVALVTGGGKRIGAAIARDLAANGFAVAVHAISSRAEVHDLCADIVANGGTAQPFFADLTDRNQVRALIPQIHETLGPVQLLVNNASIFLPDEITALDDTIWDAHFAVHVQAPAILSSAMHNALPTGTPALIVNMIDQRVWRLTPRFFSYTLSKSALWTATQTMAQALAPTIRVNAIGPGPTLPNERQELADFQAQIDAVPLQIGPELAAFGKTVRYFWDNPSITGQMIALDGGQHLAWQTPDVINANE